jgi:hypothetical protein
MRTNNHLQLHFVRADNIVSRRIGEEIILVPVHARRGDVDSICTLNEVGARIWELLDGTRTLEEISSVVTNEYDVASGEAKRDVEEFVSQLEELGMLTRK